MDDLQERVKKMWAYLKENGIHSEEDLNVAIKNMPKLDVGIFVSPIKGGDKGVSDYEYKAK
ncbi:hypothetical protein [Tepidibacter hydrothermalis]|uniref:Uncharacterized protein n=1 Tax=Tepidibacter hydrothermalis TaxID=3036126 RepID=A0ABY8EJI8_9FIRM|nr:hypothetical protein [Tepidibacter hydrothermalis]WFD11982.1 hypothetical protein P4S50_07865 [Tepidibacter hydrothermalis]